MRKIQLGVSAGVSFLAKKKGDVRMIYDFGISDKEFDINKKHTMGIPEL